MQNINVPVVIPNPVQFQPPTDLINSYLARKQQGNEFAINQLGSLADTINQQRQQKVQNQLAALQAYAGIAKAVGPDAANQVAGQIPNMPTWNNTYQSPAQGSQPAAAPIGGVGGGSGNVGGQGTPPPGVNPAPNAGQTTPSASSQGSPQTLGDQSNQDPSQAIQASLAAGHPDYTGQLAKLQGQMAGYQNKGDWGKEQAAQLAQQATVVGQQMNNQRESDQFAKNQTREANQFATSQANEKSRTAAAEISKQGPLTTEVKTLQGMFDNVDSNLQKYYSQSHIPGSSNAYQLTKGRVGSKEGATVLNQSAPLVAAINKSLTSRFNMGENELLSSTIAPSPNDTPDYAASKMKMLHQLIQAMDSGNKDNVSNVIAALNGNVPSGVTNGR